MPALNIATPTSTLPDKMTRGQMDSVVPDQQRGTTNVEMDEEETS